MIAIVGKLYRADIDALGYAFDDTAMSLAQHEMAS